MNPLECIGWHPSLSLIHRLSEAGYTAPWEMKSEVFDKFVEPLSAKPREEFERIDRALHAAAALPETVQFYEELISSADPALIERVRGIQPDDTLRIFATVPEHEDRGILPGDFVALDPAAVPKPKGRAKPVSMEVKAMDIDWPGLSTKEWVYAPVFCQNYDASVHDFLVAYALDAGHFVPPEVYRQYIMRV